MLCQLKHVNIPLDCDTALSSPIGVTGVLRNPNRSHSCLCSQFLLPLTTLLGFPSVKASMTGGVKSVSHRAIAVDENFVIGSPVIISHGISLGQLRASWKSGP